MRYRIRNGLLLANWYDEIIYHESVPHLFADNVTLLIELLQLPQEAPPTLIAWGHVLMKGLPLDSEVGVTLYKVSKLYKSKVSYYILTMFL